MKTSKTTAALIAFALFVLPKTAAAAEQRTGWSINFTPVVIFPKNDYRFGGGADPELKYTLDLGGVRLSAGARVGSYYAKNLFGVTTMPTLRISVPVGQLEPYASVGVGYGWLPERDYGDLATMSRVGAVFKFSERFAIGLEGTLQDLIGSEFSFFSLGSMMAFHL